MFNENLTKLNFIYFLNEDTVTFSSFCYWQRPTRINECMNKYNTLNDEINWRI